ncbi:MAG: hypothetical protein ACTHOH_13230 [Lysobacteraceae bacterium]
MAMPAIRAALKAAGKATPAWTSKPANVPTMPRDKYADPKAFLLDVMNLDGLPIAIRADAAKQLLAYMRARIGEVGKKETKKENARAIARGKHRYQSAAAVDGSAQRIAHGAAGLGVSAGLH